MFPSRVEVVDEEIYTETNANATKVIYDVLKRLQSSGNGITIKRKTIPTADTNNSSNDHIEPTANEPTIDEETPDTNIEILEELEPVDISDPDFYTDDKLTPITKPKKSSSKTIVLNVEAPPIYICLLCQSKFSSFEALAAHMKNNRHCKEISQKCDKCGKVFDTRKSLQQHLQTHKDKPTLVCEQCGKTFAHQFSLDNHKSSQHGEYEEEIMDSIYRCKECDAHFTNRRELYEHISKHTKVPTPVLCDYCGRSFKSSDSLRSHMRCHQNVRPFPCTFCDRRFRSRLQMQQHLHVHTGVKLFKCQYCDREFAKKDSLVAHTRTHTGELPYPCSHCEMKFATLSKRKTHCRLQHARETPDADEVKEDMPQTNENSANIFIEHTIETHSGIAVGDIQSLSSTTTPYVTYSTAFIDSDNILVFETPVDADMPLDDMLSGASSLDVIQ